MLSMRELAQKLAVLVNGEYTGFGESALDTLGMTSVDENYNLTTDTDVQQAIQDIGVESVLVEYNVTDSTTIPEVGWVTDEPTNAENPFWSRITITRTNGEVKRLVSFSGGGGEGGGEGGDGGGGAIGSVSYKLPDIINGYDYTPEQLKYWKDKYYSLQDVDLQFSRSSDTSPVTIDAPVTKPGILYQTASNSYLSIAIRVRYMRVNPGINKTIIPPGADKILADIQANDTTYEIVQCRVKDLNGYVWEGFVDASTPNNPKTVVGNKFEYGKSCFTTSINYKTTELIVNREVGINLLTSAEAVDYSDATTNYNDETPFAYVIPQGDMVLTFDNTTGRYSYKGSFNVIIQPYVGRWKAPMFYTAWSSGLGSKYTRPATLTNTTFNLIIVPTKTYPGKSDSDKIKVFN